MKMLLPILAALLMAPGLQADDFTLTDGTAYTNCTIKRVEPDGLVVMDSDGVRKLWFAKLPVEVQKKYAFDQVKALHYQAAAQAAEISAQKKTIQNQSAEERFSGWRNELTRLRNAASNLSPVNPERKNANEVADLFELRFSTLKKLIGALDHEGAKSETTQQLIDSCLDKKVFIGMPAPFVMIAWGVPSNINRTRTAHGNSEQWVYQRDSVSSDYVNLENDIVESIQN